MGRKEVVLVLGSGAARGLAHIGIIRILEEEGFRIKAIYGTSIGALVGGIYAAGVSGEKLKEIAYSLNKRELLHLFAPTFPISGLVEGERITRFLETLVGNPKIEDLPIPFTAIATDLFTGAEVILSQGSLLEAIRASISIPGIFTPVKMEKSYLVDGGLVNPLPVNRAREERKEKIIAVNVIPPPQKHIRRSSLKTKGKYSFPQKGEMFKERFKKLIEKLPLHQEIPDWWRKFQEKIKELRDTPSIFSVILQTIAIVEYQLVKLQIEKSPPDVFLEPQVVDIAPLEFFKTKEAISAGEEEIKEYFTNAGEV